jgi:hypothetical protein
MVSIVAIAAMCIWAAHRFSTSDADLAELDG